MGIYRKSTGTKVTVRYLDIFKENGAAVAAGTTMPVGPYTGTVGTSGSERVITQLTSTSLDETAIAALTSATVVDISGSGINTLDALKAASGAVTAYQVVMGGESFVVVTAVTAG